MSLGAAKEAKNPTTVPVVSDVAERARRLGPLSYSATGRRGPRPAPDLAPMLASLIDSWWDEEGRPDPWTIVDVGAGDGKRAADLLATDMRCLSAVRYVTVEDDGVVSAQQTARLPIESPILVLGPIGPPDGDTEEEAAQPAVGIGPLVTSLAELPVVSGATAILAVGWLGRLPADRFEWRDEQWWEIRLAARDDGGLEEVSVPMDAPDHLAADELLPPDRRVDGGRYARLTAAAGWLAETLSSAPTGRLAVVDRWTRWSEPVREGEDPNLALDQLEAVRKPITEVPEELFPGWSLVTWRLE